MFLTKSIIIVDENGLNSIALLGARTWIEPGAKTFDGIPLFSNEDGKFFMRRNGHTNALNKSDLNKFKNLYIFTPDLSNLDNSPSDNVKSGNLRNPIHVDKAVEPVMCHKRQINSLDVTQPNLNC